MGKPIAGSLEKVLSKTPESSGEPQIEPATAQNLSGYIYVPSINVYVAKERTHHGLNWHQTHEALHNEGLRMPTIHEFREFLLYLQKNPNGVQGATNEEVAGIFDDIVTVRNPNRAEWLDADFKVKGKELYIHYNHRTVSGTLTPQNKELLTDYLTENKTPGIYMHDWLQTANNHGLPKSTIAEGNLYYWAPMKDNKSVARFDADSVGVGLFCDRDPGYSGGSLGLFASISASQNENK